MVLCYDTSGVMELHHCDGKNGFGVQGVKLLLWLKQSSYFETAETLGIELDCIRKIAQYNTERK